jgi:2-polyprenyl-3-methyl-5-hydroxy-6-metoxy-1,4-benzoquinol methylase
MADKIEKIKMTEIHRIYGNKIELDSNKVKIFWEQKLNNRDGKDAAMLSDKEIADLRNQRELKLLRDLIGGGGVSVLDIGCGLGRWADNLGRQLKLYDGVDFSKPFIEVTRKKFANEININFHHISVTDVSRQEFQENYDLIIINGLCMYMNDDPVNTTLKNISGFIKNGSNLYFRESCSTIEKRLTLKDFPSEELKTLYNAIYRTPQEYEAMFNANFESFNIQTSGWLHSGNNDSVWKRTETNQYYWFIESAK